MTIKRFNALVNAYEKASIAVNVDVNNRGARKGDMKRWKLLRQSNNAFQEMMLAFKEITSK